MTLISYSRIPGERPQRYEWAVYAEPGAEPNPTGIAWNFDSPAYALHDAMNALTIELMRAGVPAWGEVVTAPPNPVLVAYAAVDLDGNVEWLPLAGAPSLTSKVCA